MINKNAANTEKMKTHIISIQPHKNDGTIILIKLLPSFIELVKHYQSISKEHNIGVVAYNGQFDEYAIMFEPRYLSNIPKHIIDELNKIDHNESIIVDVNIDMGDFKLLNKCMDVINPSIDVMNDQIQVIDFTQYCGKESVAIPIEKLEQLVYGHINLEVTKLEKEVIDALIDGLYAEPGFSDMGVEDIAKTLDLKIPVVKGVLGSLVKKGVCDVSDDNHFSGIIYLNMQYWGLHERWYNEIGVNDDLKKVVLTIKN